MHLHAFDYLLWVIAPCLQGSVLLVMHRRGMSSQFPVFCWYSGYQVASDLYLLAANRLSYSLYFYCYWITTAITVLFTFVLIDELFRIAFRNLTAIRNLGTYMFRWGAGLLMLAALANVLSFPNNTRIGDTADLILTGDRAARAMLCLLTLLLLLGARQLHIPVRSVLFGITLGFAVYMFGKVCLDTLALHHFRSPHFLTRLNSAVYLSACLLWLLYAKYGDDIRKPEEPPPVDPDTAAPSMMEAINVIVEESMRRLHKTS